MSAVTAATACCNKPASVTELTQEQRSFAANHHALIYAFLRNQDWDPDEYYDIAALGYLAAVKYYLSQPMPKQYAFSTVAWHSMGRSISSYRRTELRRRETERRYIEAAPRTHDPMEEVEAQLIFHELASTATPEQYQLAALRVQGYSIAETAKLRGMQPQRVSKLLREMYRVYLQLYKN